GVALVLEAARPNAHLAQALGGFASGLKTVPNTPGEIAARLADLAQQADTIVVRAREQSGEQDGGATSDLVIWSEALRSSVAAHRRDLDMLAPWTAVATGRVDEEALSLLGATPTLSALAQHCETTLQMLVNKRAHGEVEHNH